MTAEAIYGDCLAEMRRLAAEGVRVQAIVTDPPYGISFMSREWDHEVPGSEYWRAAFDLLPPGGHLLAFGGTRAFHRLACAIEDAGFEIRDTLMWLTGQGFPKSLDVSKAIDKRRDDSAAIVAVTAQLKREAEKRGISRADVDAHMGTSDMGGWWLSDLRHRCQCPTWEQWLNLKALLGLSDTHDAEVWRLNGRKGSPGEAWHEREVVGTREKLESWDYKGNRVYQTGGGADRVTITETAPATDAARQWQGWGTALKPAWEPIIVARKPLEGTVAVNVLAHGTGALNIDACRVPLVGIQGHWANYQPSGKIGFGGAEGERQSGAYNATGRWPANVIHDGSDEVEAAFATFGERGAAGQVKRQTAHESNSRGDFGGVERDVPFHADTGTASRFFYCAKASKADRAGSKHPTVKPQALMRWLCRLVTPPGGTVLDPFAGSGSTLQAAMAEGFNAIGIEREAEYHADCLRRIEAARASLAAAKPPATPDLFSVLAAD